MRYVSIPVYRSRIENNCFFGDKNKIKSQFQKMSCETKEELCETEEQLWQNWPSGKKPTYGEDMV